MIGQHRAARAVRAIGTALLPVDVRNWIRTQQRRYGLQWTRVGTVEFGHLRRVSPISPVFAFDRGQLVDRYYIEQFLSACSVDVRGCVLEMMDDTYTRKFGGARVTRNDVFHSVAGNPRATIVADLTGENSIPDDAFDCIICTQTLQFIYDFRAALRELHRILKPGGVLLLTTHGTSRIGRREGVDSWGEYWRFTAQSMRRLLTETFSGADVRIDVYGNVLAAVANLHCLAAEELTRAELDHRDPDYEVLLAVRAVKER
ncbi:MAG: class I SAM-dependent methyltransferase [Deltaproteobacteria bacterium]|nr:class I SAM-dependent methyltransferase [Deltaproteobacteria bacterium]